MRLLVTGGAGYVGSHVVLAAIRAGHEAWIYDDFSNSSDQMPFTLGALLGLEEVHYVKGDIRDTEYLARTMSIQKTDCVIHMAAKKYVDEGQEEPLLYHDVNVGGTISVVKAMEASGVHQMVFSSSAAVYGDAITNMPVTETDPSRPTSVYGCTKMMCEEILRSTFVNATCLRYFNPVASSPGLLLPDDPSLMSVVMSVSSGRKPKMEVFGEDYSTRDGTPERDFVHVMDVAEAHVAAVEHPGFHIYNIGTGRGTTVLELIAEVDKQTLNPVTKEIVGRRAGDIGSSVADVDLIRRSLGWTAERSLSEMVRDSLSAESSRLSIEQ